MRTKFSLTFMILLLVGVGMWALASCSPSPAPTENGSETISVDLEAEQIFLSREAMFEEADIIFVGKVTNISPTKWNQDSGEYWQEVTEEGLTENGESATTTHSAWPVHELEVAVGQAIVDEVGIDEKVTLTLLGKSPVDSNQADDGQNVQIEGDATHAIQLGDEILVFAVQTEIAWRDPNRPIELVTNEEGVTYFDIGKRSIIAFVGIPSDSYLIKGDNGLFYPVEGATESYEPTSLEQLIKTISEKRETLIQP